MKGVYDKKALTNIVEPLKAITSVFGNKTVHIVYENDDDTLFASLKNPSGSIFAMYELNVKDVVKNYEILSKEIGVWETKFFMDILSKYQNEIYTEPVLIDGNDNHLKITCGNEETIFGLGHIHMFAESRANVRRLKTEVLTEATNFELTGSELKKILININVFSEQEEISFHGKKGDNHIKVKLFSRSGSRADKNETIIEGVEIKDDFNMIFPKEDIKGLLVCNTTFDFSIFTGKKQIINANYSKESYNMKFYISPLED